jgi:glycosyltransferase involved in cell wall biosynthesis
VDSILKQSYSDFELIISDDYSSDGTMAILRGYERLDVRIKIIENPNNVGLAKNFERGLMIARGKYIAMSDQDDYWLPNKIESQVLFLEQNNEIGLVFHDSVIVSSDLKETHGSFLEKLGKKELLLNCIDRPLDLSFFIHENCIQGATMLFRSDLVKTIIPIIDGIPFVDVWIAFIVASIEKIYYLDEIYMKYRQHSSNTIGASTRDWKFFINRLQSKKISLDYLSNGKSYTLILKEITEKKIIKEKDMCLVEDKIKCLGAILSFLEKKGFMSSLGSALVGFFNIMHTKQYRHLIILVYFCINKPLSSMFNNK